MKIERTDINNCNFSDVCCGEAFIYQDMVYIKFDECNDLNCINMVTGYAEWLDIFDKVKVVNAKLVIE